MIISKKEAQCPLTSLCHCLGFVHETTSNYSIHKAIVKSQGKR